MAVYSLGLLLSAPVTGRKIPENRTGCADLPTHKVYMCKRELGVQEEHIKACSQCQVNTCLRTVRLFGRLGLEDVRPGLRARKLG